MVIIGCSGGDTLTDDKIIKSPFNKNKVATIKTSKPLTNILFTGPVEQVQWC